MNSSIGHLRTGEYCISQSYFSEINRKNLALLSLLGLGPRYDRRNQSVFNI